MSTPDDVGQHDEAGAAVEQPEQPQQPEQPEQGGDPDWSELGSFDEVKRTLAQARKWEQRAKENKHKADRLDELERQNQTEAQQATARAERAESLYAAAVASAVDAEIRAAAHNWAEPSDAPRYLDAKTSYVDEHGEIDRSAIIADIGAALKQRPHLAAPEPEAAQRGPRPDPAQGANGDTMQHQLLAAEQSGDVRTSLALKAQQLRTNQRGQ